MTVYYYLCQFLQFQLHHNPLPKYVCAPHHSTTMPQFLDEYLSHTHIYIYVDLNLLVGVMTFTFSPLHCFYATIMKGGAADRRRRPILVRVYLYVGVEHVYYRSTAAHYIGEYLCRRDTVILVSSWLLLVIPSTGIYTTRYTASYRVPGMFQLILYWYTRGFAGGLEGHRSRAWVCTKC